jgi:predicted dehydrogenase
MARSDWGIGIVGLGGIANTHIQAYRNAGLKIVGGADVDEQRAKAMKERWQLPFVTTDWRELIDHPEVRIVDVTAPHKFEIRMPIVEYAAQKGKALFVQKPLLPYLDQARKLVEVAEQYGVPLMVNQNSVFVPAFLAMERYLRDGTIGTPYYCQIENRAWVDVSGHPWFGKDERWVTSDMAVHHFALVHHWFGEWESVYAIMGRDPSQTGVKGDNFGVVLIRFKNSVQACIINNWHIGAIDPAPTAVRKSSFKVTKVASLATVKRFASSPLTHLPEFSRSFKANGFQTPSPTPCATSSTLWKRASLFGAAVATT